MAAGELSNSAAIAFDYQVARPNVSRVMIYIFYAWQSDSPLVLGRAFVEA
jgi:hypothetical protein